MSKRLLIDQLLEVGGREVVVRAFQESDGEIRLDISEVSWPADEDAYVNPHLRWFLVPADAL